MAQRTHQELLLLYVSGLTVIALVPFMLIRFIKGDVNVALLNSSGVLLLSLFFSYVYRTRKTEKPSIVLSIFLVSFILVDIHLAGRVIFYWVYPTLVATYYLTHYKVALKISLISIGILSLSAYPIIPPLEFSILMVSTSLINVFSFFTFRTITRANEKLENLATTDMLTQCYNRRALDIKMSELISRYNRSSFSLCLIIFDLDHFKSVNDTYGHVVGDNVLKEISSLVMSNIRAFEKTYRYGGEEFIILPIESEPEEAMHLANKLRTIIEKHPFPAALKLTISLGVAQYREGESAENWIERADEALYQAKQSGRNKAIFAKR